MPDKVSMTRYNSSPKFFGKGRTKFDLSHSILTTGNTGDLIPILCEPIVPGSTFSLKTASLTRLETSFHQTMDNAYVEFAYFFVPSRVLWTNFDKYQGFNRDAWAQTLEYTKPQIELFYDYYNDSDYNVVQPNSLLAHLAIPSGKYPMSTLDTDGVTEIVPDHLEIDQLPLRAVFKCYNDYFRDTNIDSEIYYDDGDTDINLDDTFVFNGNYFQPSKQMLKVNRFKDVFSTSMPQPQKGDPVKILLSDQAPVGVFPSASGTLTSNANLGIMSGSNVVADTFVQAQNTSGGGLTGFGYNNVIADLSGVNFTVNDLRTAIAIQAMRERDLRSGNRLNEKLYGTWHLQVSSLELDRAEFLGGKRIPVNMMEVLQTSETGTTVLGSDAGHSKTFDSDDSFIRTFTQWGYVIGFVFVRTSRSYSTGIDRKFFVKDVLDEYDPMLDNIGEMPVYKKELNAIPSLGYNGIGANSIDNMNKVFGYQEAWYWYKERSNRYSGYFQNNINGTLDSWHYGDAYQGAHANPGGTITTYPAEVFLSPSWLKEEASNVDRTIAVSHDVANSFQWMFNIHFDMSNTFEASKYSIPNTFGF